MTRFVVVLVTASSQPEAERIAGAVVEEELAACVNIISPVRSTFRWCGEVSHEQEALLILKTRSDLFEKLEMRVKELHSYELPEIIALPVFRGSSDYLSWLEGATTTGGPSGKTS